MTFEASDSLQSLPNLFNALDSVLSIHYASSITVPKVHDLCEKATRLTKRRVDINTIEQILGYDLQVYQIIYFGSNSFDYGMCSPKGLSPLQFGALLPSRRISFKERVSSFRDAPPIVKLSEVAVPFLDTTQGVSLGRLASTSLKRQGNSLCLVTKSPKDTRISSKSILSLTENSALHSCLVEGLSLIERIKQKERKNKLNSLGNTIKENHVRYIRSKVPVVYDILYELTLMNAGEQKPFKTVPTRKLISIIKDSLSYSMTDEEISDTIHEIARVLQDKVKVIQVGEIHAIKIFPLNRNQDLDKINKTD
ncbi:hypothetical protein METBIDRAFT_33933 [Metschnikowia bicuspidata var. bicuspidata NRRL YB-4993]|uniref:DNA replication factor Cdt1 C-terminal domain-containing protein n=1 Tax=Metschnikowia bicuspidata var. bicuspidata NRRL YB-4993 TaxID=869754 RepID=A0A1A0HFF9_9ASCO|nr:hypothetical protein METBIDRAFT_33933 [Metschnikowia bicuspidata var. bicuspidata NRRL YB-4993]OBA22884.1 hypothetical protein METBIDRAFT_33933 [Metschnikowia bicuspidata var. bicuspidata NRRL YB-4993]